MRIIKQSTRKHARLSLILLDWGVRETFHLLHYLKEQTVPREAFEVVVIEYYDTISEAVGKVESEIDTWVLLEMPPECYYHKHLMYNAGTVLSGGEILLFGDSDAMVRPTFVESILAAFERDRLIVYHMDEFRNIRRDLYPFNYPSFEDVLGDGCVNNFGNKTRGILDDIDPLHTRNYGACMCAYRDDIISIGGADEDLTYLGHICGPYDMTFRLMNLGRRLDWETKEYLYHTWHPGSDGIDNYFGPHDGRHMSTTAFEALCSGRIPPLVENKAVRRLRTGSEIGGAELEGLLIDSNYVRAFDRTKLGSPPRRPVAPPSMSKPVYGSYRGFDLYRMDGSFYAAPPSLDPQFIESSKWRADQRIVRADSFTEIRDIIDGFGDPLAFKPELIETLGAYNICAVGKRFAVVPLTLGVVDFRVAQDRENPRIAWEGSLVEAFRTARRMNVAVELGRVDLHRAFREQNATTFSLIIPTRQRTVQLRGLLDSVRATCRRLHELEVILVIDDDDEETIQFQYDGIALKRVQVSPGLTMGALNMSGYRAATGRYLMLLNDDVILRTPDWDEQVRAAFLSCPDGMALVHVNDLVFKDTLCIFPFLTREFCLLTDGICPEGYLRYRIDDHIHNIFDLLSILGHRRRIFLPNVVFEHTNIEPAEDGGAHNYVPDPVIHAVDTKLFDSLLEERKKLAVEAMRHITGRLDSEKYTTWTKKLNVVKDSVAIRRPNYARWFTDSPSTPSQRARVTIGVVSADSRSAHTRKCIELVKTCTENYDLILIDNNGDPDFNHSHEMNRILSICTTDYLVLMDDDVFVQPGWLEGMLRCLEPGVGAVTPCHKDRQGELSYAGIVMRPDESGHHTHILDAPAKPRRIQTLCSAILLIDMPKCGHIRLDERYTKYFLDIDYGLRVWEEGFQVVCSPYSTVAHLAGATLEQGGPRSMQLLEEQRRRYSESWVDSGRIQALRQGIWSTIPEISWIHEKSQDIDRLIQHGATMVRDEFMRDAVDLVRSLAAYPALKDYLAEHALLGLGEHRPHVGDPLTGYLAFLLGLSGRAVLYEANFKKMNIVLEHFTYYAIPQDEGGFSRERIVGDGYSHCFEAESPVALKSLIRKWRQESDMARVDQELRNNKHPAQSLGLSHTEIVRAVSRPPSEAASGMQPKLLSSHQGYNLVEYHRRIYGVPQSLGTLGPIDWASGRVDKLPGVVIGSTTDEVLKCLPA